MWLQSLKEALGAWGEIMDNAAPLPKKRFSLRGNLLRLRMLLILVLVAIVAFTAWQQLSPQTYSFFTSYLDYATSPDAFAVAVESFRYGFETNPIARSLELFILALCLWKLVFRGGILAFLSIKSIVMVSLSVLWIDLVLFRLVDITRFPLWYDYWAFMAYSPFYVYLYPLAGAYTLRVCVIASCFLACLAITVLFFTATREGKRISGTDLERLGIDEVMAQVNPIRKLLRPRPHFYVTDAFRQNAYACGRNIVIASDIYGEGLEVAQGVLAHELGHYYHYDTDASFVCHAAVNTVIFPLMLVVLIVRVLSYVPFLGIFAAISGLLVSLFGSLTAFLFRLVNLLFYWVDGKWSERSADIFGVDLGFGTGNYRFLSKFATRRSFVSAIHGFFDVHPGCRNRCRYIKKRIIRNYGEKYWQHFVSIYGDRLA